MPKGHAWFTDETSQVGLDFVHLNGMTGKFYYPEVFAPGMAIFDYDNDGDLDVFAPQGTMLGTRVTGNVRHQASGSFGSRLYRNDLEIHPDGTRRLFFTDVSEASGIVTNGYAMGAATGDFDNDGCVDLFVSNLDHSQLFRNDCDGTFTDVSTRSRATSPGWSVSAAFVDYDRDGWLDIFVGHYVHYSIDANVRCFGMDGSPDYCPPRSYRAQPSHLYRNNRDGTFADITAKAGMAREFGPTLGVSTADFDGDGWIDIYIANDSAPNQLWLNQQDGTFRNAALLAGAALSLEGEAKASMGVDAGDIDNDGDEDILVTELTGQGSSFYVNDGRGVFEDRGAIAGIRGASLPFTGFGAGWIDFDNDGVLDIFAANGAVVRRTDVRAASDRSPLAQRNLLLRQLPDGQFRDVTADAGAALAAENVGRGVAFGDVDNDGDTDVLVGVDGGGIRLLMNHVGSRRPWLGLRLTSSATRRDALGARVKVVRHDGSAIWRRARADGSYASANDPRVLVGLGDEPRIESVVVQWPDGSKETWTDVRAGAYSTLQQGSGTPSGVVGP